MGVKGLLQALKPIAKEAHLSHFSGQKVAIDGYAWLHRAAFTDLNGIVKSGVSTKPVTYCLKRLAMVRFHGVRPLVVFDGKPVGQKSKTNLARRDRRNAAKEEAERLRKEGDSAGAYKALGQAVSITWDLVEHCLSQLKLHGYEFIVAPYEADAQLAYLSHTGYVDFVISEDSDLLLYGCRKVFFKLNDIGHGFVICDEDLPAANILPLSMFDMESFITTCIISGCDYTDGIRGLGLKKGAKLVATILARESSAFPPSDHCNSPNSRIKCILNEARCLKLVNEEEFEEKLSEIQRSYYTFKYQTVYDPKRGESVRNHTPGEKLSDAEDWDFLGPLLDKQTVSRIALGEVNPFTLEPTSASTSSSAHRSEFKVSHESSRSALGKENCGEANKDSSLRMKATRKWQSAKAGIKLEAFFSPSKVKKAPVKKTSEKKLLLSPPVPLGDRPTRPDCPRPDCPPTLLEPYPVRHHKVGDPQEAANRKSSGEAILTHMVEKYRCQNTGAAQKRRHSTLLFGKRESIIKLESESSVETDEVTFSHHNQPARPEPPRPEPPRPEPPQSPPLARAAPFTGGNLDDLFSESLWKSKKVREFRKCKVDFL